MAIAKTVPDDRRQFVLREEADPTVPRGQDAPLAGRYAYGGPEAVTRIVGQAAVADTVSKSLPRPVSGPRAAQRTRCDVTGQLAYRGINGLHVGLLEEAGGTERAVAVKRLDGIFSDAGNALPQASPDVWLGCNVEHPNLVRAVALISDQAATLCAFEYAPAESLTGLLRDGARPPVRVLVAIIHDVLRALQAARQAVDPVAGPLEIVHGALSPDVILVGEDGLTRVVQFGLARRLDAGQNGPFGRPGYAAPEQVFDQRTDASSDVFAVGVLLWEGLTGRRLLEGESAVESTLKFLASGAAAPSTANPRVLLSLDSVVQRALEPTPERRFASAQDFALALTQAVGPASAREVSHYVQGLGWAALERHRSLELDLLSGRLALSRPSNLSQSEERVIAVSARAPSGLGARRETAPPAFSGVNALEQGHEDLTRVDGSLPPALAAELADAVADGDGDAAQQTVVDRAWGDSPAARLPAQMAAHGQIAAPAQLAAPGQITAPAQIAAPAPAMVLPTATPTLRRTAPPFRRRSMFRWSSSWLIAVTLLAVLAGAYVTGRVLRANAVQFDWRRLSLIREQPTFEQPTTSTPSLSARSGQETPPRVTEPPGVGRGVPSASNAPRADAAKAASEVPVLRVDDLPLAPPSKKTRAPSRNRRAR